MVFFWFLSVLDSGNLISYRRFINYDPQLLYGSIERQCWKFLDQEILLRTIPRFPTTFLSNASYSSWNPLLFLIIKPKY